MALLSQTVYDEQSRTTEDKDSTSWCKYVAEKEAEHPDAVRKQIQRKGKGQEARIHLKGHTCLDSQLKLGYRRTAVGEIKTPTEFLRNPWNGCLTARKSHCP